MDFLRTDTDLSRNSYYAATARGQVDYPALDGDLSCDVLVIGGGLAGLSAALELASQGQSVVLLEAKEVSWGASGRNGGQLIHGYACGHELFESALGPADARIAWDISIEALDLVRERCREHAIDCDLRDGFLHAATTPKKARAIFAHAEELTRQYGYEQQIIPDTQVRHWIDSPRYHGLVYDKRSGHVHPLNYAYGIARAATERGARLFEHTTVTKLNQHGDGVTAMTAQGSVRAQRLLLAGNVYLQDLVPALKPRIMPAGTYVMCTEPLPPDLADSLIPSRAAVADSNFVLDYFRITNDNRVLYGGAVSYSTRTPSQLSEGLRQSMVRTFPQLESVKAEYCWGGFVDISRNRAPDFGRIGKHIYYLQGFSGHGLALTGMAGRLVAQAMHGDAARFDLFTRLRHRAFPGGDWLRTPALVLGMAWYRLRDLIG